MKATLLLFAIFFLFAACSQKAEESKKATTTNAQTCSLTANTTETTTTNSFGCSLRTRDTSSCQTSRTAQGLSGFWLKFSCRVTLTKSGGNVIIDTDNYPDHKSAYFASTDPCYEAVSGTGRATNPNSIAEENIRLTVSGSPAVGGANVMTGGTVGIAVNGVSIYSNAAAPPDNIYEEVATFDNCEGHPDPSSKYHYHTEPHSISNADFAFVGVMRDGFPIYGVKDMDGSTPTLDAKGGHTAVTPDSNGAAVYHYHVHLQTDGTDSAYFITSGDYAGSSVGTCSGCL